MMPGAEMDTHSVKQFESIRLRLPPPRHASRYLSTEEFIYTIAFQENSCDRTQRAILERLCKKVDVAGRVHAFYQDDFGCRRGEETIHGSYAALLASILLHEAKRQCDRKFLNTALKILDWTDLEPGFVESLNLNNDAEQAIYELVLS